MLPADGTVLIVDDNADVRSALVRSLAEGGLSCQVVGSVGEALAALEKNPDAVQAVVSEIQLPDGTGLSLLEEIKRRCWRHPVIFLAADSKPQWVKQAIWAGAFEYLDKPTDVAGLTQAIESAIRVGVEYAAVDRRRLGENGFAMQTGPEYRDQLTGVASHRCVLEMLPKVRAHCSQKDTPLSLCMLDIDGFRALNIRRGFAWCDRILTAFAARVKGLIRFNDMIGRYGGDEFLILLPGSTGTDAYGLAQRILHGLRADPIDVDGKAVKIPVCAGLVHLEPGHEAADLEFIDRAIEAVYYAKLAGPGTIVTWEPNLMRESLPWDYDGTQTRPTPDVESINIMVWRFRELHRQLATVTHESLRVLVAAVEARDPYTKDHSVKVAALSKYLAERLELSSREVQVIHSAALLHDIGKIGVPDAILTKPGRLTDEERALICEHPVIGTNILQQTRFFSTEVPLIKHHHERIDGGGYPDGLRDQDIPLGSRVIHLADSVEAMLARRSYKEPFSLEYVIKELREGAGSQFDRVIVELGISAIQEGVLDGIWSGDQVTSQAT